MGFPRTPAHHRCSPGSGSQGGAGYWLLVNAVTLPTLFGQQHPWERGPAAVWPSLLVHVIFGLGVAAVLHVRRRSPAPVGGDAR